MVEALTDVRQISSIAYGFLVSKALFAALNIGLFGRLASGPADLAELAEATKVSENRLATLLAALVSVGLLTRDGERYVNSPAAQRYLSPDSPAYFGDYYRFQIDRQIYPNMTALDAGIAGDQANLAHQSMSGWLSDSADASDFSKAQHAGSAGPALLLANAVDFAAAENLLDVAGGTGAYAITLCNKHPGLNATIIDFPAVIEVSKRFVAEAGMTGRIALVAGDALEIDWPGDQDAVLMSYLLSAVAGADIETLLTRAWNALRPGGRLVVHDFMLHDDHVGPVSAAAFFLCYLALRTDTVSFTSAEIAARVRALGYVEVRAEVMIPEITKVVVARKP